VVVDGKHLAVLKMDQFNPDIVQIELHYSRPKDKHHHWNMLVVEGGWLAASGLKQFGHLGQEGKQPYSQLLSMI